MLNPGIPKSIGWRMIDHISIPVTDLGRSTAFYDAVFAPLGLSRRRERPGAVAYGSEARKAPVFWILDRASESSASAGVGLHLCFEARTRQNVRDFYEAALRRGGVDAGPPGMRPQYTMPYYGAFVLDPDGFKIEAVCRGPE